MSFALLDEKEEKDFKPQIVILDEKNNIISK
jgi:aspartate 1-decarboxylase